MIPVVVVCAVLFDLDGDLVITPHPDTSLGDVARRVSKDKTLDGGVAISDGGFTDGDRELSLVWKTQAETYETIARDIVAAHSQVYAATSKGVFLATPVRYSARGGTSTLQLTAHSRADV